MPPGSGTSDNLAVNNGDHAHGRRADHGPVRRATFPWGVGTSGGPTQLPLPDHFPDDPVSYASVGRD